MIVFFIAFIIGLIVFILQVCVHLHTIRQGIARSQTDHASARLKHVMRMAFGQKRVMERWWGKAHAVIFYAFLIFLLSTLELLIEDLVGPSWSLAMTIGLTATGVIHLVQTYFAWMTLAAVFILTIRRIVRKKEIASNGEAWLILSLIAIIMLSHIAVMASRMVWNLDPQWLENWLPITAWIASFMNRDVAFLVHDLASGTHVLAVSVFLIWIPNGKHLHILFAFPNLFYQYERYDDKGMPVPCMDNPDMDSYAQKLEDAASKDLPETEWPIIGAEKVHDLKRRLIMNALTCTRCQRCTNACPMVAADSHFQGPMESQIRLRDLCMNGEAKLVVQTADDKKSGIISAEEVWQCTQCGACDRVCSVGNENLARIIDLRRSEVCRDRQPAKLNALLSKFERSGNPWGYARADRNAWKDVLSNKSEKSGDIHVLLFAGCMGSYDDTARKTLKNCAQWLEMNGFVVHTLDKESCCGEFLRKLGHEQEFAECMKRNLEEIAKVPEYESIVTICPHCANTLRNEYPGNLRAKHFLEFVAELCDRGILEIDTSMEKINSRVHVPCGLGKVPETPKRLLRLFHELGLEVSAEDAVNGHCCGGGGGQFFLENSRKIAEMRVNELLDEFPEQISTCCPFCVQMLDSELKSHGSVQEDGDISLIPVSNVVDICISRARRVSTGERPSQGDKI